MVPPSLRFDFRFMWGLTLLNSLPLKEQVVWCGPDKAAESFLNSFVIVSSTWRVSSLVAMREACGPSEFQTFMTRLHTKLPLGVVLRSHLMLFRLESVKLSTLLSLFLTSLTESFLYMLGIKGSLRFFLECTKSLKSSKLFCLTPVWWTTLLSRGLSDSHHAMKWGALSRPTSRGKSHAVACFS